MPALQTDMRRLACLVLLALVPAVVSAQSPPGSSSQAGCDEFGALDFEIGVRLDDASGTMDIDVYDVTNGEPVPTPDATAGVFVGTTGCNWVARVGEPPRPGEVRLENDRLYRLTFSFGPFQRSYYYALPASTPAGADIFSPRGAPGAYPDLLFFYDGALDEPGDEEFRVFPTTLGNGPGGRGVDDFFPGDWVLPYDLPTICAEIVASDPGEACDPEDDTDYPFLATTPYSTDPVALPVALRTSGRKDWTVPADRAYTWSSADVSEVRFRRGVRVRGGLDVTGMAFRSNDAQGWSGFLFRPGATGTLDTVTIQEFGDNTQRHAVAVQSADVDVIRAEINSGKCCAASGIRVTGADGSAFVSSSTIAGVTGSGVLATGGGTALLVDNEVFGNADDGVVASNGGLVRLQAQSDGPQASMSNEVENNPGWGVRAIAGATVVHARIPLILGNERVSGYTRARFNFKGGIEARTGSEHNAGSSSTYARDNWFSDNGPADPTFFSGRGPDAASKGVGTAMPARYSWWGRPTNPDTLSADGGFLAVDPMLAAPPGSQGAARTAAGPAVPTASGLDESLPPLVAVYDALGSGRRMAAVGRIEGALVAFRGGPRAAAALRVAAGIASGDDVPSAAAALGVLRREAASARGAHRAWARRGLLVVAHRSEDARALLAVADALAAEGDAEGRLLGHIGRAYALARTGDADGAWAAVAAADALAEAPDRPAVEAAREDVAWITETEPPAARAAAGSAPAADAAPATALGAPFPNPAAGPGVTVPFALAHDAHVRLAVYDVLGRRVAVLADGPRGPGAHAARLDASALAPGPYVVRLEADGRAVTRPLTLAR